MLSVLYSTVGRSHSVPAVRDCSYVIISPNRIPVAGPSITEREVELTAEAARTAWFSEHYKFNRRFETEFANYIGVRNAVSLPHCTAGLHLALAASEVGQGDEVIVPNVTWIASVAPVKYVGADLVFVDILSDTWCIDPDAVEAAITPRTKAIIGVDLYGSMCRWERLREIAHAHDLILVEDAAEALGSQLQGRKAGSFGHVSAFSFHGSKTLVTGEGGMLATDDPALFDRVLSLRDHGRAPGDRFFQNTEVGFKYRMSGVQAALGVAQMERIDELVAYKRLIYNWYMERIGSVPGLKLNVEPEGTLNSFWMVTVVPDREFGKDKFEIMAGLEERNIDSRPFFAELTSLDAFKNEKQAARYLPTQTKGRHPAMYGVNLPSGYNMTEETVDIVCRALCDILSIEI